jgi:hypothetical protein
MASGTSSETRFSRLRQFETLSDPWYPRDADWLLQGPSQYGGAARRRPVLIGACPRSGTTLLRGLLNNHWDLAIPGESNFIFWLVRHRAGFGNLRKEANRRRLAEWIVDSEGRGARRIQGSASREETIRRMVDAGTTIGAMFAAGFDFYAERHGAKRWGDKRPGYAGFIATMFELFPDAQFINLVRDPRGAVASQVPLGWDDEGAALPSALATWETSIQRVDEHARHLRPDQLLDVRFEDLLRDPHGTLRQIFEFLRMRRGDELIEGVLERKRRGEFRAGWHDRLNDEIDTDPIDNWRKRLSPEEVAFVERVTGPYLERFGYRPLSSSGVRPDPALLAELERQRERRAEKWTRYAREERINRVRTLWAPVAAPPLSTRRRSTAARSAA